MIQKLKVLWLTCLVIVLMMSVPVDAKKPYIKLSSSKKVTIPKGYTSKIKAVSKGKKCKLRYTSSKKKVATVTSKGVIKGKKYGSATITIKGKGLKSKKIKVYIKNPITKLTVTSSQTVTIPNVGKTSQIKAYVTPSSKVVTKALSYKSSNTKVATVSSKGLITGKSVGFADITVSTSAKSGKVRKTTIFVFVNQDLSSVKLSDMNIGTWESKEAKPVFTPWDATLQDVRYRIADTSVACVDDEGVVTGVAETNASTTLTVTATDTSGNVRTGIAKVTVTPGKEYQWPKGAKVLSNDGKTLNLSLDTVALNHKISVLFRVDNKAPYSYSFLNIEEDFRQLRDIKVGTSKTNSNGITVKKTYGSSTGSIQAFTITLPNGEGIYTLDVDTNNYQLTIKGDDTSMNRIRLNTVN